MSGNAQLPIDPLLPEIVSRLRSSPALVLEAPPGAGKTTRVPRALLEAGLAGDGEVVVLQPRRLATRLAAQRVADELGERIGQRVGYQVRFDDVSGPATRLRFVTEGVLGRRLLSDPLLKGVGVVVLDEFHERHLSSDVSLAMVRQLQRGPRPDLKLMVMSATLDAAPLAEYLACPRLRSEGRRFDVGLEYLEKADERHLDQQVLGALKRLIADGLDGDVLVFLPGASEIRRASEACADLARRHGIDLLALHGDLSSEEQDRAVRPGRQRKVILSTNVAETSVTIEGVAVVVDSGVARVASHSPWSGLPILRIAKVSKASATQRAGRAGRTRSGHCLRLYTRHDFDGRPEHDAPEIRRMDLCETLLALRASGVRDVRGFPFFEAPPEAALTAAESLLHQLGAVDAEGGLTPVGSRLLRFPVHPRQARVLVEGERRGVPQQAILLAALLGERDIRRQARAQLGSGRRDSVQSGPSDVLELFELFRQAERARFSGDVVNRLGLDSGAVQAVDRVRKQLSRAVPAMAPVVLTAEATEQAMLLTLLAGYPDRVAKRRKVHAPEVVLAAGGMATLSDFSVVREPELLVAVDAEEQSFGRGTRVLVRTASQVEAEWLLDLFPEQLVDVDELVWNADAGRVDRLTRLSFGNLVLEEKRVPAAPSEAAGKVLAQAALAQGLASLPDYERLQSWLVRLAFVARAFPEAAIPAVGEGLVRAAVERLCATLRTLEELRESSVIDALNGTLDSRHSRLLATAAPERLSLPGGRQVRVNYELGKDPWVESRLQDFFGMVNGPRIGEGRLPVVLHLLAPNQRAVQVTTDLSGFWERHYPAVRRELMRKYPRHSWPEDPAHAAPPAPGQRRR